MPRPPRRGSAPPPGSWVVPPCRILSHQRPPDNNSDLHVGAHTFTEIAAGCPRISTTLLAQRLQALERAAVVERRPASRARGSLYHLTPAGEELVEVALQLGNRSARWLELAPQDYDPFVVLWAWKMHVDGNGCLA